MSVEGLLQVTSNVTAICTLSSGGKFNPPPFPPPRPHLDAVRGLIYPRGFNHCLKKNISSEQCCYVQSEPTDLLSPLQPGVAFLYSLKTSENLRFSDVFRGYRKATPGCNELSTLPRTGFNAEVCSYFSLS